VRDVTSKIGYLTFHTNLLPRERRIRDDHRRYERDNEHERVQRKRDGSYDQGTREDGRIQHSPSPKRYQDPSPAYSSKSDLVPPGTENLTPPYMSPVTVPDILREEQELMRNPSPIVSFLIIHVVSLNTYFSSLPLTF